MTRPMHKWIMKIRRYKTRDDDRLRCWLRRALLRWNQPWHPVHLVDILIVCVVIFVTSGHKGVTCGGYQVCTFYNQISSACNKVPIFAPRSQISDLTLKYCKIEEDNIIEVTYVILSTLEPSYVYWPQQRLQIREGVVGWSQTFINHCFYGIFAPFLVFIENLCSTRKFPIIHGQCVPNLPFFSLVG